MACGKTGSTFLCPHPSQMFSCFQRVMGLVSGGADVPTDRCVRVRTHCAAPRGPGPPRLRAVTVSHAWVRSAVCGRRAPSSARACGIRAHAVPEFGFRAVPPVAPALTHPFGISAYRHHWAPDSSPRGVAWGGRAAPLRTPACGATPQWARGGTVSQTGRDHGLARGAVVSRVRVRAPVSVRLRGCAISL